MARIFFLAASTRARSTRPAASVKSIESHLSPLLSFSGLISYCVPARLAREWGRTFCFNLVLTDLLTDGEKERLDRMIYRQGRLSWWIGKMSKTSDPIISLINTYTQTRKTACCILVNLPVKDQSSISLSIYRTYVQPHWSEKANNKWTLRSKKMPILTV